MRWRKSQNRYILPKAHPINAMCTHIPNFRRAHTIKHRSAGLHMYIQTCI